MEFDCVHFGACGTLLCNKIWGLCDVGQIGFVEI